MPRWPLLRLIALVLPVTLVVMACRSGEFPTPHRGAEAVTIDAHSYSHPDRVAVTHADIDWHVDFASQTLSGTVVWTVSRAPAAASEPLILDTRGLKVLGVQAGIEGALLDTPFELGEPHEVFGTALIVPLQGAADRVAVAYETTVDSSGIQWLAPAQTAGKKHPYLYSQAQAIHARTYIPCQDTPGVRFTFDARITAPKGVRAVMAARSTGGGGDEPYRFEMPQPIPSYLFAFAVGDIAFRPMGPRTGVYAEPSILDAAAFEFSETEKMMEAAEGLYGPYRWERYDILVLPPSFPFGGMENPRLTFATPTVLAGDRSLVALIAHELAHSWSGNLVTNASWSDFWLNEGFTVYFERRIMEAVYGPERAEMEAVLGRQDLADDMAELPAGDTILKVDLTGRDPDDAFSNVPYEKGYLFLRLIDETVGRERFDPFLKNWFESNAFESRTTEDFLGYLRKELLADDPDAAAKLDIDRWIYEAGVPDNEPHAASTAFTRVEEFAHDFAAGTASAGDIPGDRWTTHEWLHFLESLPDGLDRDLVARLDHQWKLTQTGNSEILMKWLLITIRTEYHPADAALENFLTSQGRRKFLKPLYAELAKTTKGKKRALAIYSRARPLYHAIATQTLDELLGV